MSGGDGAVVEACHYFGPYPGNFVPTLLALDRAVRERLGLGYHCVFPARMRDRPWVRLLQEQGVAHSFVDPSHRLAVARELHRVAVSSRAVLLRSHFSQWDLAAGAVARRVGAASVWHMHSGRFARRSTLRMRARDAVKARALGGLCDLVVPVSDEIHRLARTRGFPERKIVTVPNGIDTDRFAHLPSLQDARAALGLAPGRPVALGFGWAPRTKGADIFAAAARRLGEAGRLTVLLVGSGSLREELGVPDDADWLHVVPPRDDVATLYAAADVFVSASRDEGFSYAIGEAMAAGLPVVSSDIEGPAAYFPAPGVRTFPSGDVAALTSALGDLLADDSRHALGVGNREYVRTHLGLPAHVDRMLELFAAVTAARH